MAKGPKTNSQVRRGIKAEIDLRAAGHNLGQVKNIAGGAPVIAVVKADAYGHGAIELSRLYESEGVHALAVAFLSEALELRDAGIVNTPVLVLFDNTEPEKYIRHNLTPVIHEASTARAFSAEAVRQGVTLDVHIKVDTGMGRVGMDSAEEVFSAASLPGLRLAGLMSHFSEADLSDIEFVNEQLQRFNAIRSTLSEKGLKPLCHIANSAAVCAHQPAHLDAVRPGLILYGASPFEESARPTPPLRPVMKVTARVLTVRRFPAGQPVSYSRTFITTRPTLAAVVAVGYADGYSRLNSNSSEVIIGGRRAPVIGRVCMDLMLVDVTEIGDLPDDAEAVLLGADGPEEITAWELALRGSTIPYEVFTTLGSNALRSYTAMGG